MKIANYSYFSSEWVQISGAPECGHPMWVEWILWRFCRSFGWFGYYHTRGWHWRAFKGTRSESQFLQLNSSFYASLVYFLVTCLVGLDPNLFLTIYFFIFWLKFTCYSRPICLLSTILFCFTLICVIILQRDLAFC